MGGFSSVTGDETIMFADNASFNGTQRGGKMTTNGQLWIGSTASPHVKLGSLTSSNSSISIGYSSPNIILTAGTTVATTYTTNSGNAIPAGNILNVLGNPGITTTGAGNTLTIAPVQNFFQPGFANIGISQSAGTTFTVLSEQGTAFSATNPGFVALQSLANPGRIKRYSVTANQSFTQAQLGNNLFGITTAINYLTDMPFYLYAVSNANNGENTIAFMISRYPNTSISPVAGKIGQNGNTLASTGGSFFSLAAITAADYASSPCLCIGSFRMQYTGGTTLWTIQTLSNNDGIGQYLQNLRFAVATGHFGAASGKYFADNGGTAPGFTSSSSFYKLTRDNMVEVSSTFSNASTAGVGAVVLQFAVPFVINGGSIGCTVLNLTNNTLNATCMSAPVTAGTSSLVKFSGSANGVAQVSPANNNFTAAGDGLNIQVFTDIVFT